MQRDLAWVRWGLAACQYFSSIDRLHNVPFFFLSPLVLVPDLDLAEVLGISASEEDSDLVGFFAARGLLLALAFGIFGSSCECRGREQGKMW